MPITSETKELVDLSQYKFSFSLQNKLARVSWKICYWTLFRPFNFEVFKGWRAFVLRAFGAKIGYNTSVQASVKIWAPWNLVIGNYSSVGPSVDCYNQGKISIGDHTIISQKSYLCASSHDYQLSHFPLICKSITIGNQVWIAADAFIAPGVKIGTGAVIAARAAVFTQIDDWTVAGGNPAKPIKKRIMNG